MAELQARLSAGMAGLAPEAERQIRPAVILRKNGQNNRTAAGAAVQSVLMSVYRSLARTGSRAA